MTALRGNRVPLSISETTVFDSGVAPRRDLASSVRSDGLSALRCTVRNRALSSSHAFTEAISRSSVYGDTSMPAPLSANVRRCPTVYGGAAGLSCSHPGLSQAISTLSAALPDNWPTGLSNNRAAHIRNQLSKDTGMIVVTYIILGLAYSFSLGLFSFWAGRCARKLPIVDDKLPWTMSRAHAPRCTADCKMRNSAPSDPPCWPFRH